MTIKNRRGFTLIELLVSISIISVLTAIGLANYAVSQKRARDARRQADLESVRSALEIYRADNLSTGYFEAVQDAIFINGEMNDLTLLD